jgi:hypothetical protein
MINERIAALQKLAEVKNLERWQPIKKGETITGVIISMNERATAHGFNRVGNLLIIKLASGEIKKMMLGSVERQLEEALVHK